MLIILMRPTRKLCVVDAATAFMENTDLNQLDFQVKIVGDVIAAGE